MERMMSYLQYIPLSLAMFIVPIMPSLGLIGLSLFYFKKHDWGNGFFEDKWGTLGILSFLGGIVAFISLGQLPRNPWGAVYEDEYAYAYLARVAPQLRENSHAADRVLIDEFKRRVKAEPIAFAAKMVWNGAISLVSGSRVTTQVWRTVALTSPVTVRRSPGP